MDIVEILKVGFSGLAFLLAWLAYQLLSAEQKKESPRTSQLNAIHRFMAFSVILGVLALLAPFMPKILEEKPDLFMEVMLQSTLNRKPMALEFVESQISELTAAHNKRIDSLYLQREQEENKLRSGTNTERDRRSIESSLRRIEQHIREENREYSSKLRDLRNML